MHDSYYPEQWNESDTHNIKVWQVSFISYSYIQIKRCCPRRGKFGLEGEQRQ